MAIVGWPNDVKTNWFVSCVTCKRVIPLSEASAGLVDRAGEQAFACNAHFWNSALLILGWIDFSIAQGREIKIWSKK